MSPLSRRGHGIPAAASHAELKLIAAQSTLERVRRVCERVLTVPDPHRSAESVARAVLHVLGLVQDHHSS